MLTVRRKVVLMLAVVALASSGCGLLAPSDDIYQIGAARIGDKIYIFAPLCADERIASVEVYDNEAAGKESKYDPSTMKYTYWKAADPTQDSAAHGWVEVGDDAAYRTVTVPAGSKVAAPGIMGVALRINDPATGHQVNGAFRVGDAPSYPAGTDPKTVKYGYRLGSKHEDQLTADQIQKRSKCAADYPA